MDEGGRVKGPVCGVENCRSRIYDEGEDGYLYCQNGHRKGELLAGADDDVFEGATRSRTRKKVDKDETTKASKYFKGPEAFDLYFKCLQLILRHQIRFLIHDKGLPAELEAVIQDLWTLRILQFNDRLASGKHQFDSSQALPASETDTENEGKLSARSTREKKLKNTPNLVDCLALCYLGAITLRLPITPGDIYAWTTAGDMAYRKAIKLLPPTMKDRLPPYYHAHLDPNYLLSLGRFHTALIDLLVGFEYEHGILWPTLNVPVLLFRYMQDLALPLELYSATIRLGELLEHDFAFHTEAKKQLGVQHLPEAQLIACLMICVKLFYPFDGERRYPKSTSEPAATAINWRDWTTTMQNRERELRGGIDRYTVEELTKLEEKDVFSMSGEQLDQYLEFYMSNFLDDTHIEAHERSDGFRNALYEMFPIMLNAQPQPSQTPDNDGSEDQWKAVKSVHSNIEPVTVVAEEDGLHARRPGQEYRSYKKQANLPQHTKKLFEDAARLAGLTLDMLIMSVAHTERRVEKWKKKQQRGLENVGD